MHKTTILLPLVSTVKNTLLINNSVFCPDAYADTRYMLALLIQQLLYPWEEQRQSDGAFYASAAGPTKYQVPGIIKKKTLLKQFAGKLLIVRVRMYEHVFLQQPKIYLAPVQGNQIQTPATISFTHFQTLATRSDWKQGTEIAAALPPSRDAPRSPYLPCQILDQCKSFELEHKNEISVTKKKWK